MGDPSRPELVQRTEFIETAAKGRSVLHLGCTNHPYTKEALANGSLLHQKLGEIASDLYGLDSDAEGLETLRGLGFEDLFIGDLERLEEVPLDRDFDVIIAGEIIEHLPNPGLFLRGIRRFMTERTSLLVTTINAYCAMRFFHYGLRGKGGRSEPVHPDHVAYYSYSTLRLLIEKEGLELRDFFYYDLGREHRAFNRRLLNFVNDAAVWFAPHLSDGLIAVCGLGAEGKEPR